jgi:hypothetical protein
VSNDAGPVEGEPFDLNIERVLEHWPVAYAVREFIANALDEYTLTATAPPEVTRVGPRTWAIEDYGRGIRYQHLTQRENPEKLEHAEVIGQFGIGLKDALAVCDRRGIGVRLLSKYGDITTARLPKAGFADIVTLHGVVSAPSEPERVGTRIELTGIEDAEVTTAQSYFLRYSGDALLDPTDYGQVLAKASATAPGRVYVKGLLVAEEPNFLFSYNVTKLNAALRRALNRERTNVGRGAYSDRIKEILAASTAAAVAGPMTTDLGKFVAGKMHDELAWQDVAIHACRVLHTNERVVFVTPWQTGLVAVQYAVDDGYRPVIVPENIARKLANLTDLDGNPILDLGRYQRQWNESFTFQFVDQSALHDDERRNFELVDALAAIAEVDLRAAGVRAVRISETMRLNEHGDQVLGLWDGGEGHIVIRRDQLADAARFAGTFLHELTHAVSGTADGTLAFEDALTTGLGVVASTALRADVDAPRQA